MDGRQTSELQRKRLPDWALRADRRGDFGAGSARGHARSRGQESGYIPDPEPASEATYLRKTWDKARPAATGLLVQDGQPMASDLDSLIATSKGGVTLLAVAPEWQTLP